jgi:hypothetical protein
MREMLENFYGKFLRLGQHFVDPFSAPIFDSVKIDL